MPIITYGGPEPKYCTFCGRALIERFRGVLECPKYDAPFSFTTDTRHNFNIYVSRPIPEYYDTYTGERK